MQYLKIQNCANDCPLAMSSEWQGSNENECICMYVIPDAVTSTEGKKNSSLVWIQQDNHSCNEHFDFL